MTDLKFTAEDLEDFVVERKVGFSVEDDCMFTQRLDLGDFADELNRILEEKLKAAPEVYAIHSGKAGFECWCWWKQRLNKETYKARLVCIEELKSNH